MFSPKTDIKLKDDNPQTTPVISVVTVVYNNEKGIGKTIQSILSQTLENIEYIVVDGASTDETPAVIHRFSAHIDIFISEPDRGVYDAMNKALDKANGEYILFINSGDELSSPDVLEKVFHQSGDRPDVLYGETNICDPDGNILGTRSQLTSRKLPVALRKRDFLNGQVVSHQSFIAKRNLCQPYDLTYSCSADIAWMLGIISKSQTIRNTGLILSNYQQGGISDTQLAVCWKERLQIMLHHFGFFAVAWAHIRFAIRFIRKGAYSKR